VNTTIWIHYARPRSSWYELAEDTRTELTEKWAEVDAAAVEEGAQSLGTYFVRGQSDYSTVDVWSFAGYEAAYSHWAAKVAAGYAEWFEFSNNVGNRVP
jgi:hypothetical protein